MTLLAALSLPLTAPLGVTAASATFHCWQWAGECHGPDGISSGLTACDGCRSGYHTYSVSVDWFAVDVSR